MRTDLPNEILDLICEHCTWNSLTNVEIAIAPVYGSIVESVSRARLQRERDVANIVGRLRSLHSSIKRMLDGVDMTVLDMTSAQNITKEIDRGAARLSTVFTAFVRHGDLYALPLQQPNLKILLESAVCLGFVVPKAQTVFAALIALENLIELKHRFHQLKVDLDTAGIAQTLDVEIHDNGAPLSHDTPRLTDLGSVPEGPRENLNMCEAAMYVEMAKIKSEFGVRPAPFDPHHVVSVAADIRRDLDVNMTAIVQSYLLLGRGIMSGDNAAVDADAVNG